MRVFISYRRDDSAPVAQLLYQTLQKALGPRGVFRDVASIPLGADFPTVLADTVPLCDVMLVLIGHGWLNAVDAQGRRRLDDPADAVRQEVAMGLRSSLLVIPVLLDDTPMPSAASLPDEIAALAQRQAYALHNDQRQGQEIAIIYRQMQVFVQRVPRHPLLRRAAVLIPVLTVADFLFIASQTARTDFTILIAWGMIGLFWSVPIVIAARAQLWQHVGRLLFPFLLYLLFGQNALRDPSPLHLGEFALALGLEYVTLSYFARTVPRGLASGGGVPRLGQRRPSPAGRWLRWAIIATASLSMLATVIGSLLLVGRDLNTDDPALDWSVNAHLAGTYVGAAALFLAFMLLVGDVSNAMQRSGRSSAWGDQGAARREGARVSAYLIRLALMFLPIAIAFAIKPALDGLTTTQADFYAVDLGLGGIGFGVGALLSLAPVRIARRQV